MIPTYLPEKFEKENELKSTVVKVVGGLLAGEVGGWLAG